MKSLLLATAASLLLAPPVLADDAGDGSTELSEVVVTATRDARQLRDAPASVSVVTAARIAETPAKSLDDVLRRIPSVDLPTAASYQLHPTADSVSMRGLGGIRALVLLDGAPLNDPFFGYVQWSRVPLEAIDRVEVVRGGGAALWGNYAMGGVISIFTRTPDRNELIVQGGGGAYGTWRANAYGALVASDRVRLGLDLGANHTDGFDPIPKAERGAVNTPTAFTAYNAALTGDFDLNPGLTARTRIDVHDNDQTLTSRLSTNSQRSWTWSAGLTRALARGGSLAATVFHGDSRFRTDNTDTPSGALPGEAEFVQNRHITPVQDTGASLVWTQPVGALVRSVSLGADYHLIDGEDVAHILDETGAEIRTDVGRGKQQFIGAFAQASLKPIDRLEVLASARVQSFRNFDAFDGSPGGLGAAPDTSTTSLDPRVSLRYALTPELALRAAAYKAFRAPTLDNLYRTFSTPFGIFYGDAALKPETLKGAEAGFDVDREGMRLQVTAYTATIDDLITARNLDPGELPPGFFFGSRNINAGSARSRGFEAEWDWAPAPGWSLELGYTFADSVIIDNPLDAASVGRQQAGVPRHRFSGGLTYAAPSGWRVSPQLRWVSRSWGDNDHTLPVDAHFVADLAASYPVTPRLDAFIRIENLFDKRYIADNSGFEPRRIGTPFSAFLGMRWRMD
jgi:outer membrane receptor protein involved in Fe transport